MSKTPALAPVLGAVLLTLSGPTLAKEASPAASTAAHAQIAVEAQPRGVAAFTGAAEPAGIEGLAGAPWDSGMSGVDHDSVTGLRRPSADLPGVSGAQQVDALPLSQFAGGAAKPTQAGARDGVWGFLKRVKSGGLPEPASWALILIGFGMIGGAVRGFVVANRRLARLQPEDAE
jgi:hypothetical protein